MVGRVAAVGFVSMKAVPLIALLAILAGCMPRELTADGVRERDRQRKEVAKTMPGNEVPRTEGDLDRD